MKKTKTYLSALVIQSSIAFGATYDLQEITKHAAIDDCWIIIQDKIYDITSYIPKHPAPTTAILKYCGKSADHGWQTKDIGKPHSSMALRALKKFEIGLLKKN